MLIFIKAQATLQLRQVIKKLGSIQSHGWHKCGKPDAIDNNLRVIFPPTQLKFSITICHLMPLEHVARA